MKNFILGVLLTIVIGLFAIGVYLLDRQSLSPKKIIEIISPTPVIKVSPTLEPTNIPIPTVKTISDNELIKETLFNKNNWDKNSNIIVQVLTNDGKYASGTATADGGGGYFYAVKDGSNWIIVADGNGMIMCSNLVKYPDYPDTLIPECYDSTTQKTVKR